MNRRDLISQSSAFPLVAGASWLLRSREASSQTPSKQSLNTPNLLGSSKDIFAYGADKLNQVAGHVLSGGQDPVLIHEGGQALNLMGRHIEGTTLDTMIMQGLPTENTMSDYELPSAVAEGIRSYNPSADLASITPRVPTGSRYTAVRAQIAKGGVSSVYHATGDALRYCASQIQGQSSQVRYNQMDYVPTRDRGASFLLVQNNQCTTDTPSLDSSPAEMHKYACAALAAVSDFLWVLSIIGFTVCTTSGQGLLVAFAIETDGLGLLTVAEFEAQLASDCAAISGRVAGITAAAITGLQKLIC